MCFSELNLVAFNVIRLIIFGFNIQEDLYGYDYSFFNSSIEEPFYPLTTSNPLAYPCQQGSLLHRLLRLVPY